MTTAKVAVLLACLVLSTSDNFFVTRHRFLRSYHIIIAKLNNYEYLIFHFSLLLQKLQKKYSQKNCSPKVSIQFKGMSCSKQKYYMYA